MFIRLCLTIFFTLVLSFILYGQDSTNCIRLDHDFYKNRYNEDNLLCKMTDNSGDGCNILYGTRNMRPVLHGVAYRGGGNNYYHQTNRRSNRNPLPNDGVHNLCTEGFSNVVYLYRENAEKITPKKECNCITGDSNTLNYSQLDYFDSTHIREMIRMTYESATNSEVGPVYLHCWNGWHASGFMAAILLKQFCGYSDMDAVNYWDLGTDGVNKNPRYQRIRERIEDFEPYTEFIIKDSLGNQICPQLPENIDSSQLFIGLKHLILVPEAIPQGYSIVLYNVSFDAGKTSIPSPHRNTDLQKLLKALQTHPELEIEIGGYTDSQGDASRNRELSAKRAKAVYNFLTKGGIAHHRLSYRGYGEKNPLYSNRYKSTRAKNRRIEVKITKGVKLNDGSEPNQ